MEGRHALRFVCHLVKSVSSIGLSPLPSTAMQNLPGHYLGTSDAEHAEAASHPNIESDQPARTSARRRPDAVLENESAASTRNTMRSTVRSTARSTDGDSARGPRTLRDRAALLAIVRLRLLPFSLLHGELFPDVTRQIAGRVVSRLIKDGFVTTWVEPRERGGRPRWVLPTEGGLRYALPALEAEADGTAYERLLDAMLPASQRSPLRLESGVTPPFLAHQRETAALLLALGAGTGPLPLWMSAWDRPFAGTGGGIHLPQPDGVLLFAGQPPELVLLEHDRGQESLVHFRAAKVERYAELAVRPDLREKLLGVARFRVLVTVTDPRGRRPLRRLRALAATIVAGGAENLFLLAPAGWAWSFPGGEVFCRPDDPLIGGDLRPARHEPGLRHRLLCPALRPGDCARPAPADPLSNALPDRGVDASVAPPGSAPSPGADLSGVLSVPDQDDAP